jgi:hypothetical protein
MGRRPTCKHSTGAVARLDEPLGPLPRVEICGVLPGAADDGTGRDDAHTMQDRRLPLRSTTELVTIFKVSGSLRLNQLAPGP